MYCSLERHRGEHVTSFHLNRDDTGEFLLACSVDASLQGEQQMPLEDPTCNSSAVVLCCCKQALLFVLAFARDDCFSDPGMLVTKALVPLLLLLLLLLLFSHSRPVSCVLPWLFGVLFVVACFQGRCCSTRCRTRTYDS